MGRLWVLVDLSILTKSIHENAPKHLLADEKRTILTPTPHRFVYNPQIPKPLFVYTLVCLYPDICAFLIAYYPMCLRCFLQIQKLLTD